MLEAPYQIFYGYMVIFTIVVILFIISVVWHYSKLINEVKQQRDDYRKQLEIALAKVMAVDYEKLAQLDIQARAHAAAAAFQFDKLTNTDLTNEFGDLIQEPVRVTHGERTSGY